MKKILNEYIRGNRITLIFLILCAFVISFFSSFVLIDMLKSMLSFFLNHQEGSLKYLFSIYCLMILIQFILTLSHKLNIIYNQNLYICRKLKYHENNFSMCYQQYKCR